MSLRLDGPIQLVREGKAWEGHAQALGLAERDPHILDEMLHEEARSEVAYEDARCKIREGPRPSSAAGDTLEDSVEIEASAKAIQERFADTHHRRGDHDLIHHFGVLTAPGGALVHAATAEQRPEALERVEA